MELLVNVFGTDRPGLVADLTRIFYDHDANLGDANMTRIGGVFALILAVTVAEDQLTSIEEELDMYGTDQDLEINFVEADGFDSEWGKREADTVVTVYGADRPGIVFRVTEILGDEEINICDLDSSRDSKDEIYVLVLEVALPDDFSIEALTDRLEPIKQELDVSIRVNELNKSTF